jgi:hypothetical protein
MQLELKAWLKAVWERPRAELPGVLGTFADWLEDQGEDRQAETVRRWATGPAGKDRAGLIEQFLPLAPGGLLAKLFTAWDRIGLYLGLPPGTH